MEGLQISDYYFDRRTHKDGRRVSTEGKISWIRVLPSGTGDIIGSQSQV